MNTKNLFAALLLTCAATTANAGLIISPLATGLSASSYSSSSQYLDFSAEKAFNGTGYWNSGNYGWAWIEADLGSIQTLTEIKLTIAQSPNGNTEHKVFLSNSPIGANSSALAPIYYHSGYTNSGDVLDVIFNTPQTGRYLQILSNGGASWTALGDATTPQILWAQPSAVPVPTAAWLFGSGLLGLVAVARRKDIA